MTGKKALEAGHDARLISAKLVSVVRKNQKTDKNDALAIVLAPAEPLLQGKYFLPSLVTQPL